MNFTSPVQASWLETIGNMLSDEQSDRAPLSYISDKKSLQIDKKAIAHPARPSKSITSPLKAEKITSERLSAKKSKTAPSETTSTGTKTKASIAPKTTSATQLKSKFKKFAILSFLPVRRPEQRQKLNAIKKKAKTAFSLPERNPRKTSIAKLNETKRLAELKKKSTPTKPAKAQISNASAKQAKSATAPIKEAKLKPKTVGHFSKMLRNAFQPLIPGPLKTSNYRIRVVDNSLSRKSPLVPLRAYRIPTEFNQFPKIYIRIFKKEHELELWERVRSRFVKKKTYKICKWSGTLGPKLKEGDKQAPEGFYTVTTGQIGWFTKKWRHSFNIGFPNKFDQSYARTGSDLLVHGGCKSIGCYAMTNENMWELYNDVATYMLGGVKEFPMHIYPFRMTNENMQAYKNHKWADFWKQLKPGYDLFEIEQIPPVARVCNKSYRLFSRLDGRKSLSTKTDCAPVLADWARNRQIRFPRPRDSSISKAEAIPGKVYRSFLSSNTSTGITRVARVRRLPKATARHSSSLIPPATPIPVRKKPKIVIKCNLNRPSCRRWLYLKKKRLASQSNRRSRQRVKRSRAKFRQKRKKLSRRSRNSRGARRRN